MIKKLQLNALLIQIEGNVTTKGVDGMTMTTKSIGLLSEQSTLGLKRKLRKIQKELLEHWEQLKADAEEVNKIKDEEKKKAESERLAEETIVLKAEKFSMSEIENISSSFPYDFELLELIAN